MSLFGNSNNSNSTFSFGNSNNNSSKGGFSFGNSGNNTNSGNSGNSLFGNNNNSGNNNKSGFSFGNSGNSSGNNNSGNSTSGSSLFGNSGNKSSGFSFGSSNNNNNNSNSLFGNKSANSNSTFNFGGNNNNNSGNNNSGNSGSSLFGNNNKSSGFSFGSNNNSSSLFGNSGNNKSGLSFGGNNNNNSNNNQVVFPNVDSSSAKGMAVSNNPLTELKKFYNSYEPNNENFRFNCILYNMPAQNFNTKQYTRPQNVSPHLWEQSMKQNPDPENLTPIFVKGYEQLYKRAKHLSEITKRCHAKKHELQGTIMKLKQSHMDTKITLQEIKKEQIALSLTLLEVVRQLLVKQNATKPLTNHEMVFRQRVTRLKKDLIVPSSRATELFTTAKSNASSSVTAESEDNIDFVQVSKALKTQQGFVRELVNTVKQDKEQLKKLQKLKKTKSA